MRERALNFGSENHLVGVLTDPEPAPREDATAVVIANVGFGHRCGPYRMYVDLARRLAARGVPSLRFNLSGLGDSQVRTTPGGGLERARADLLDALAYLERRRGVQRFALVGLCSAVDPVHAVALEDARVTAAAFLDGYAYQTLGYRVRRVVGAATHPRKLLKRVTAAIRAEATQERNPEAGEVVGFFERTYPSLERFREQVLAMHRRGVRLHFTYTHTWHDFNHERQVAEMLQVSRLPPGISVEYCRDADHLFSSSTVRAGVVSRLAEWLVPEPGPGHAAEAAAPANGREAAAPLREQPAASVARPPAAGRA